MGAGILEDLCSKARGLTSAAFRGRYWLSKARVIKYEEMVHLWSGRGRMGNKEEAGAAAGEEEERGATKKLADGAGPEERELEAISL